MKYNIFTYSTMEERKSGALTNAIFSFCLGIGGILCTIINWGITSFLISPGRLPAKYPVSQIYFLDYWLPILYVIGMGLFILYIIFFGYYGAQALLQLLTCYVGLEDGTIIKMRWKSHGTPYTYKSIAAAHLLNNLIPGRSFINDSRLMTWSFFIIKGILLLQNPEFVNELIISESSHANVECSLLKNIELAKQKKKYLIIKADVTLGDKTKRKKLLIYHMYEDMDAFVQLCKGEGFYVHL